MCIFDLLDMLLGTKKNKYDTHAKAYKNRDDDEECDNCGDYIEDCECDCDDDDCV